MEKIRQYAVITGASGGLGKAFAIELAKRKINLILMSLAHQGLDVLSQQLKEEYNVDVHFFEIDLSFINNVLAVAEEINSSYAVFVLINNAGVGGTKQITDAEIFYITNIIQVNVMATVVLTRQLLPNLLKQSKSYILNVSSLAGFTPIGYKTVYPASKAFIHSFSRGLYEELKKTSVFVSVVNPGAMATNEDTCRRIKKLGFLGKITLLSPDKAAKKSIDRLFKRDTVIMLNKLSWLIIKLVPIGIRLPLMSKVAKKEISV